MLQNIPINLNVRGIIVGSSMSGKSRLITELVKHKEKCFLPEPERVMFFCRYPDTVSEELKSKVEIYSGLPTRDFIESLEIAQQNLIIIDDLAKEAFNSLDIANLFMSGRHSNISTIILSNLLFSKEKYQRECSVNSNLFILMANPRDASSINALGYQLNPRSPRNLSNIYFEHIQAPFRYLVIDLHPKTPKIFRYRTNLLSESPEIFLNEAEVNQIGNLDLSEYGLELEYLK